MRADRAQVERLLKTARGQIDGVLKMVDENRYCMDIANQLLACEAVLRRASGGLCDGGGRVGAAAPNLAKGLRP